jgi:hypothetical protein
LAENRNDRWYGDDIVTKVNHLVNDCLPGSPVGGSKVEEAEWDAYNGKEGKFHLGNGEIRDGTPTGNGIIYGRTVWHGNGSVPYSLVGAHAPTGSGWCVIPRSVK